MCAGPHTVLPSAGQPRLLGIDEQVSGMNRHPRGTCPPLGSQPRQGTPLPYREVVGVCPGLRVTGCLSPRAQSATHHGSLECPEVPRNTAGMERRGPPRAQTTCRETKTSLRPGRHQNPIPKRGQIPSHQDRLGLSLVLINPTSQMGTLRLRSLALESWFRKHEPPCPAPCSPWLTASTECILSGRARLDLQPPSKAAAVMGLAWAGAPRGRKGTQGAGPAECAQLRVLREGEGRIRAGAGLRLLGKPNQDPALGTPPRKGRW